MRQSGEKNKTKILHRALEVYLKKINREKIINAYGKLNFDLDVRKLRDMEHEEI